MTSRIFFVTLFTGLALSLSAQFGLRAGLNFSNASIDFGGDDLVNVSTGDSKGQFMAGIFYNIPLLGNTITVQPEINYMGRGYSLQGDGSGTDSTLTGDYKFAYLDAGGLLRINLGGNLGLGFYIGAGPFVSFALGGQFNDGDLDFDAERIRRNELLLAGAFGLRFSNFFVEARYYGSLTNQSELDLREINQRSLGLNAGISF